MKWRVCVIWQKYVVKLNNNSPAKQSSLISIAEIINKTLQSFFSILSTHNKLISTRQTVSLHQIIQNASYFAALLCTQKKKYNTHAKQKKKKVASHSVFRFTIQKVCNFKHELFSKDASTAQIQNLKKNVTFWMRSESPLLLWCGTGGHSVGLTATANDGHQRACVALRHRSFCTSDTFLLQLIPALYSITPTYKCCSPATKFKLLGRILCSDKESGNR